jgi:hypothetical protein
LVVVLGIYSAALLVGLLGNYLDEWMETYLDGMMAPKKGGKMVDRTVLQKAMK